MTMDETTTEEVVVPATEGTEEVKKEETDVDATEAEGTEEAGA